MKPARRYSIFLASLLGLLWLAPYVTNASKSDCIVYVATYKSKSAAGIYAGRFDAASGRLSGISFAAETVNPSCLATHPNGRFLYASNNYQGKGAGSVSAFAMDRKTGKLTFLNTIPTRGQDPYFLAVDKTGKAVIAVNYASGSVVLLPIKEDGSLSEVSAFIQRQGSSIDPGLQSGPHPHSLTISADNRFVLVADRGTDQVAVYRLDPLKGSLTPHEPPDVKVKPGSGPRHIDIHPNGKFVYAINELSNSVTAFDFDATKGILTEVQTVPTLPKDFTGRNLPADIHVHPSGMFLYGSNRGHDSIAVFQIDLENGALRFLQCVATQGKSPRAFGIDPTGSYLIAANQTSGNLVVFRIDRKTGGLTPTGQTVDLGTPVCIRFVEAQ
jgi:6-phosphogluconolactonase